MAGYAWAEELEAYCFTAVVGLPPDEVIRRLGADPDKPEEPRTFEECFWTADGPQWAQVGPADGGLVVAEHNGFRAEQRAARLSEGGVLACFFRNVQAVMRFVYAVDGAVLAEFDPLVDRLPPGGVDPASIEPALDGLSFGLFTAEPSALTLLERLTGVRIQRSWLDTPQRAVALPPLR